MIILFGGTTEGRKLAAALASQGEELLACVTSAYARSLLPASVPCRVGVLDREAMQAFLAARRPDRVIDATHPYAAQARANIRACCETLGLPLERVERPIQDDSWHDAVEWVDDPAAAAEALRQTEGPVLLTTGSKNVAAYACVAPERLWVRVLPTVAALDLCAAAGIPASHIIAMQGPFSDAFNAALYDLLGVRVMVTKDSGAAGGVDEKVRPALARGIHVIVIRRPEV